ncbi:hypothetical protein BT96DRAFT_616685 [Gymnopus androsaceus JB14]|uniref:Uncharacterized protein n=1 Tax=Gymnopus androsaceus JB14 TaxID=1447944 RepID=A0A6A4HSE6_9AGAR|nr:hypothetical protein BT96DRAFT_616685 [Gymnopus androsaceus JB14]
MGLLQTWLYIHWYPKDHWGIKLTVAAVLITETVQSTSFFASTYQALIDDFGNSPALVVITWYSHLWLQYIYD